MSSQQPFLQLPTMDSTIDLHSQQRDYLAQAPEPSAAERQNGYDTSLLSLLPRGGESTADLPAGNRTNGQGESGKAATRAEQSSLLQRDYNPFDDEENDSDTARPTRKPRGAPRTSTPSASSRYPSGTGDGGGFAPLSAQSTNASADLERGGLISSSPANPSAATRRPSLFRQLQTAASAARPRAARKPRPSSEEWEKSQKRPFFQRKGVRWCGALALLWIVGIAIGLGILFKQRADSNKAAELAAAQATSPTNGLTRVIGDPTTSQTTSKPSTSPATTISESDTLIITSDILPTAITSVTPTATDAGTWALQGPTETVAPQITDVAVTPIAAPVTAAPVAGDPVVGAAAAPVPAFNNGLYTP